MKEITIDKDYPDLTRRGFFYVLTDKTFENIEFKTDLDHALILEDCTFVKCKFLDEIHGSYYSDSKVVTGKNIVIDRSEIPVYRHAYVAQTVKSCNLSDDADTIRKKIKKAVTTDEGKLNLERIFEGCGGASDTVLNWENAVQVKEIIAEQIVKELNKP